jgi:hypothetical protein
MDKNNSNGCCNEESQQLKIDSDQNVPEAGLQTLPIFPIAVSVIASIPAPHLCSIPARTFQAHSPPLTGNIAIYLRNCFFLI